MKHLTLFALLFATITSLCACGAQTASSDSEAETCNTTAHEAVLQISQNEFVEKLWDYTAESYQYNDSLPCIVDFTATWCAPCQKMVPILEELATQYAGKIRIYQIDVDRNKQLASDLNINGIPHFLFLPTKGEPSSVVGSRSKADMQALIEERLLMQ